MSHETLAVLALLILVVAATAMDFRRHRIPNNLSLGFALLGFIAQYTLHGFPGLGGGAAGGLAPLLLLLPFYAAGWMGAGDIKLAAATGVFFGWPDSLLAVGLSLGFGSLAAFVLLALGGGLRALLGRYSLMARSLLTTGGFAYIEPRPGEPATRRFPYAFAIALGTVATLGWTGRMEPLLQTLEAWTHAR